MDFREPRSRFGPSGLVFSWIFYIFSFSIELSISMTILGASWDHFSFKNPPKSFPKSIPRCINFWIDFGIDFSSILDRLREAKSLHLGAMFAFKSHWKSIKNRSGSVLVPSKSPGSLRILPGSDFSMIFDGFYIDFSWFSSDFRLMLEWFWMYFSILYEARRQPVAMKNQYKDHYV